jgi:hypothetical protein
MIEAGYRFGKAWKRRSPKKEGSGLGTMVGATLALVAFLLAFVVSYGGTFLTERRHLVVDEANAIGTTYLRAGYLAEPYRTEAKELLREYTDLRLEALESDDKLEESLARSEEIHNELWADVEKVAVESPTPITSTYITTLNDVIDLHAERVAVGLDIRIPPNVMLGLYIVAMFTMFLLGMQSADGEKRNYFAQIVLVLILSVVFFLIEDIDRSREGFLQVSQQPMVELQRQIGTP